MDTEFQTIVLSREAFDKFIETCNNPPPPTQALIELMREYGRFAKDAPANSTDR